MGGHSSWTAELDMDKFQASSPEELERLRGLAARNFGTLFLHEALRRLHALQGSAALDRFEADMISRVAESKSEITGYDRMKELAIEDLRTALNEVRRAGA
jgi:ethanolamine ammonia-lyase large subunit